MRWIRATAAACTAVEGCLSSCIYMGVGVLAYFELQGQSRGRVGAGNFPVASLPCSFSKIKRENEMLCFRAHSRTLNSCGRVLLSTECKQPSAEAISAGEKWKVASKGATAGSGPKWSRVDLATHCAIGREEVAYSAPAEGARAGARQSKQWDLAVWPFTGTYYRSCHYATKVERIWICID